MLPATRQTLHFLSLMLGSTIAGALSRALLGWGPLGGGGAALIWLFILCGIDPFGTVWRESPINLSFLYRFTIPRPFCCFIAGFCGARTIAALATIQPYPWWIDSIACGSLAIWAIISWRWRWIVETREIEQAIRSCFDAPTFRINS